MLNTCALLITTSLMLGQAEQPSAYEHVRELEWLVGDRVGEYCVPEGWPEIGAAGTKVVRRVSVRWALNKSILLAEIKTAVEGKPEVTSMEIAGWDPMSKQLVHWVFPPGGKGSGVWSKDGDDFVLKWSIDRPEGVTYSGTSRLRKTGPETSTWKVVDCKRDGKKIPDIPVVEFKPDPEGVPATQSSRQDFEDYCQQVEGRWLNMDEKLATVWFDFAEGDEKAVSHAEGNIVADGRALSGVWHGGSGTARWITTWNPVSRQIEKFCVVSDGTVWEEVRFRKADNQWGCIVTLNRPDGTKDVVKSTLTVSDDGNTHTYSTPAGDEPGVYHRVGGR